MITVEEKKLLQELIYLGITIASSSLIKVEDRSVRVKVREKISDIMALTELINNIPLKKEKK